MLFLRANLKIQQGVGEPSDVKVSDCDEAMLEGRYSVSPY